MRDRVEQLEVKFYVSAPLSSAEAPSISGRGRKTRKIKNRGSAGDDGKSEKAGAEASRLSFSLPSVPRALSFLFSPGSSRLLFTSPQFPVCTKKKQRPLRRRESPRTHLLFFISCHRKYSTVLNSTFPSCAAIIFPKFSQHTHIFYGMV